MTHPHLEGLIRKWHGEARAMKQAGDDGYILTNLHADELEAALAALPGGGVDEQDAERYRWLKSRLLCADFHYGQGVDQRAVIVFEWPENARISANLDEAIDAALPTPNPHEADQ